jgi:hypothetical protein
MSAMHLKSEVMSQKVGNPTRFREIKIVKSEDKVRAGGGLSRLQ